MGFDYQTRARGAEALSSHAACMLACLHRESTLFTNYQIGEYRVEFGKDLARLELEWNAAV